MSTPTFGANPHAAEDAERDAALGAVERLGDQRQRGREHHRAADALHGPEQVELQRRAGEAARSRGQREDDQADREDAPAAEQVGERAGCQQEGREAEGVGVDHPLEVRQ